MPLVQWVLLHRALAQGLLVSVAVVGAPLAAAAAPDVIASIKPVHSLVAAVMAGVGEPAVIIDGAASPHSYALKPSQAAAIEQADVVFWVGPELEAFLEKPIETLGAEATVVDLGEAPGMTLLPLREGGSFEPHEHDHDEGHEHAEEDGHDEGHEHSDDHAEADEHRHDAADMADADDDHDHGEHDMHVWLDPMNAKAMVGEIAHTLEEVDPANADTYAANAAALTERLDVLVDDVHSTLTPVKDQGFVVFHDAYHYFEDRFGLSAAGSITVSPEVIPGAERIVEIQAKVRTLDAACVFAEPQFEPKLISVVIEGSDARSGVLDPLGAEIPNGPELYFTLISNLADSMRSCLLPQSREPRAPR
jgi:zinc transport system substrate-binding protein